MRQVVAMRGGCALGPGCVSKVTASQLPKGRSIELNGADKGTRPFEPIDESDFVVLSK